MEYETTNELWAAIHEYWPYTGDSFNTDEMIASYEKRAEFVTKFSWAYPTRGAIEAIVQFANDATILEVGAGLGLWARLLRSRGAIVIPTDESPPLKPYTFVHKLGARAAVRKYKQADVLMLCWPPYAKSMANRALTAFTGSRVVYIGERRGGCTGDDAFFNTLDQHYAQKYVPIPQWFTLHDGMWLCTRHQD